MLLYKQELTKRLSFWISNFFFFFFTRLLPLLCAKLVVPSSPPSSCCMKDAVFQLLECSRMPPCPSGPDSPPSVMDIEAADLLKSSSKAEAVVVEDEGRKRLCGSSHPEGGRVLHRESSSLSPPWWLSKCGACSSLASTAGCSPNPLCPLPATAATSSCCRRKFMVEGWNVLEAELGRWPKEHMTGLRVDSSR